MECFATLQLRKLVPLEQLELGCNAMQESVCMFTPTDPLCTHQGAFGPSVHRLGLFIIRISAQAASRHCCSARGREFPRPLPKRHE